MKTPYPVKISNVLYAALAISALLCAVGFVVAMSAVLVNSGNFYPKEAGLGQKIVIVMVVGVVMWLIGAIVMMALRGVILWMELGEDIRYRCVVGQRRVAWSDVADLEIETAHRSPGTAFVLKILFGFDGELVVTPVDGKQFSVKISREQFGEIALIAQTHFRRKEVQPFRLPRSTAIGLFILGVVAFSIGVYVDYSLIAGIHQSGLQVSPTMSGLLILVLAFVLPVGGLVICGWASYQLFKPPTQRGD